VGTSGRHPGATLPKVDLVRLLIVADRQHKRESEFARQYYSIISNGKFIRNRRFGSEKPSLEARPRQVLHPGKHKLNSVRFALESRLQPLLANSKVPRRLKAALQRGCDRLSCLTYSFCRPERASARISLLVYSSTLPLVTPRASRVSSTGYSASRLEI
jgi:hypothetical protein